MRSLAQEQETTLPTENDAGLRTWLKLAAIRPSVWLEDAPLRLARGLTQELPDAAFSIRGLLR